MSNEVQDIRDLFVSTIKAKVGSATGVVLEATAGTTGRVVVVELPDQVGTWDSLGCFHLIVTMSVAVIITPPWDNEGGRRLMNDVVGAMSAVASLGCMNITPASRGDYTTGEGSTLPCYRFTAQYPKPVEG